jgi:rhodanese-related sulfurtransferase
MKTLRLLFAFLATTAALLAADVPKVAPADAAKLVAEGKAVLVDCREPAEWTATGVAAPAVLLPKSDFDGEQKEWKDFLAKNSAIRQPLGDRGRRAGGEGHQDGQRGRFEGLDRGRLAGAESRSEKVDGILWLRKGYCNRAA